MINTDELDIILSELISIVKRYEKWKYNTVSNVKYETSTVCDSLLTQLFALFLIIQLKSNIVCAELQGAFY